jgi:hypothetical protein
MDFIKTIKQLTNERTNKRTNEQTNEMSCSDNTINSIYIPTVKKCYSDEKIMLLFWRHGLGKVNRVDFVPIIKENDIECPYFKQAFLYVDSKSAWHPDIVKSIEEGQPYKIYPNKEEAFEHLRDEKEYWLILKNKCPVPYATTTLNVHQLANNLALLEQQMAEREAQLTERELELTEREAQLTERELELTEREAQLTERELEIAKRELEIAKRELELTERETLVTELEAVNTRLSNFNRDRTVDDNDENMEEIKAYNFVNSLDNVLKMMKKAHNEYNGYIESEEVDYEEYSRSDRINNDEDDECCEYCQMNKKLVLYNWRCEDGGLCKDCADLLTEGDE